MNGVVTVPQEYKHLKWIKPFNSKAIGDAGEDLALEHLLANGLTLVARNVSSRFGEIDLIMYDKSYLVFIEVKYRKTTQFGNAFAMVSLNKQQKIIKTAKFFMQNNKLNEYNTLCRFDIVALEGEHQSPTITWLKNAFYGV